MHEEPATSIIAMRIPASSLAITDGVLPARLPLPTPSIRVRLHLQRIGTHAHALAHAHMSVDERATAWPSMQAPEITCQHIGASTSMAMRA